MSIAFPDRKSQQTLLERGNAQFARGAYGKIVFYLDKNHRVGYVIDLPEHDEALRNYALQRKQVG